MLMGTVKWFNNAKGYGFILPEGGGEDLFVHYSSIQMEGYKTLKAGQAVHYDNQQGDKGSQAVNVSPADSTTESAALIEGSVIQSNGVASEPVDSYRPALVAGQRD